MTQTVGWGGAVAPERRDTCIHVTDSLHYIAETNTTLQSNDTSISKPKKQRKKGVVSQNALINIFLKLANDNEKVSQVSIQIFYIDWSVWIIIVSRFVGGRLTTDLSHVRLGFAGFFILTKNLPPVTQTHHNSQPLSPHC